MDNIGRVVFKQNITKSIEDIQLSNVVNGSYYVSIEIGEQQILKKIQIIN
jgi:hypothetical protein